MKTTSSNPLVRSIVQKRIQRGMTQDALAKKIGTRQPAIARFESGTGNPSVAFLDRVARALGSRVKISLT